MLASEPTDLTDSLFALHMAPARNTSHSYQAADMWKGIAQEFEAPSGVGQSALERSWPLGNDHE